MNEHAAGAVRVHISGQFCYASADRGGAGGWQVLERTPAVEPLIEALVRCTPTALESLVAVQDYPVPGMARRLMVSTLGGLPVTAAWHSVPAGRDGSGRPGNVFTHGVVLDDDAVRPAQLWECDQWLQPFGPDEVNEVRLPAGDSLSCAAMVEELGEFLFNPLHWRIGTLAVLLDAVRAALAGGPRVILLVPDHDEAARWIQAVHMCTDARSARRVHFSTFERHDAPQLVSMDLHVVGVPAVDAAALEGRTDVVVIDCAEFPQLGGPDGGPHRTSRGDEVAPTPWSGLLLERCVATEDLVAMVAAIDELAASLPGDHWDDPAWPLALLCFEQDATRRDAAAILAQSSPLAVAGHPTHHRSVAAALDLAMGDTAEEQWQAVRRLDAERSTPMMRGLASANFVLRALHEPAWLGTVQPEPTLDEALRPALNEHWPESIRAALQALLDGPADLTQVRAVIRACDLLDTLGWDSVPVIAGGLEAAAEWVAEALISGNNLDEAVSRAREGTRARLRGALFSAAHLPSLAMMIPGRVLDAVGVTTLESLTGPEAWLDRGAEPAPLALEAAARILADSSAYSLELRQEAQFLRIFGALVGDRSLPAWSVLAPTGSSRRPPGITEAPITTSHLDSLLSRFGSRVPSAVVDAVVLATTPAAWPLLAETLRSSRHASADFVDVVVELAAGKAVPSGGYAQTVRLLDEGLRGIGRLSGPFQATAQLWVVAAALAQPVPRMERPGFLAATSAIGAVVADDQVVAAASGLASELGGTWTADADAGLWLLRSVAWYVPGSPVQTSRSQWVSQVGPAGLVEALLVEVARRYAGPVSSDTVTAAIPQLTRQRPIDTDWRPLERFLQRWLRNHRLDSRRSAIPGRSPITRRG